MLVSLHKEGEVEISQGGRDARVNPGDIFMIDPSRPFTIQTGAIRTYSIYLQPASIRQLVPQLDGLTARPIPGYGGAGAIFRALLDEVFQLAPALNEAMADRIADAVPYVLATALGSLPEARDVLPTQLKLFHKQRIRSFAREHLDDPQLDPERIAHAVNLSERYIHQLFSDEPLTLMKWIWSERLDRCAKELAEPALQNRSIGEIAYSWGFSDLAHFSRAFRERFGRAPRQFRQDAEQATGRQN